MTTLYQALTGDGSPPSHVIVEGGLFPILTDFRHWMYLETSVMDKDVPKGSKLALLMSSFSPSVSAGLIRAGSDFPFSIDAAVDALQAFFRCNRKDEKKKGKAQSSKQERPYDFVYDMDLIYAAFLSAYTIDLSSVGNLHWWKFRCLFNGLPPESAIKTLMKARLEPLPEKPTPAARAKKEAIALPERIRYFAPGGRAQTEAEWIEQIKAKRADK